MRFRKRNDVAYAGGTCKQHDQTIKAKGNAAMRWGTKFQSAEEKTEAFFRRIRRKTQRRKHTPLHIGRMNAYGAAAYFIAVEYKIIGTGAGIFGVTEHTLKMSMRRRRKRMMTGDIAFFRIVIFIEWKIRHPQKIKTVFRNKMQMLAKPETQISQSRIDHGRFSGLKKNDVALLQIKYLRNAVALTLGEKLCNG
ncbi:hypothetical protein R80B4_02351 [Fibrobacteres bacterium R8-0-B4]